MLRVMELHDLLGDEGLEGVVGVGEGRELVLWVVGGDDDDDSV